MRAAVTAPYHNPVTGKMVAKATVLGDVEIAQLAGHPELLHNIVFTDRTPTVPTIGPAIVEPVAAPTFPKE